MPDGLGAIFNDGDDLTVMRIVIEGKKYPNWRQVPPQYQGPVRRELEGPEAGINILRF